MPSYPPPCHGLTRGFRKVSSGGSLGEGGVAGALVWELGDRLQFSAWHSLPGTPGARTYLEV